MKKVVVIGPESTGKSTLCKQLASHYNTIWCPEYAREYLLQHGTSYIYEDLLKIAKGQLQAEDAYTEKLKRSSSHNQNLIFIDTDMYVMKVWCEFVFGKCHQFILENIIKKEYDLYLLCAPDLPWTKDELREYPDVLMRTTLYHIYKDILINQPTPWSKISGLDDQRLLSGINAIDALKLSD